MAKRRHSVIAAIILAIRAVYIYIALQTNSRRCSRILNYWYEGCFI